MKGICPSSLFLPRRWSLSFMSSLSGVFIFIHLCCCLILHVSNYLFWRLAQNERTVSCRAKRWMASNLSQSDTEDNFSLISVLIWFNEFYFTDTPQHAAQLPRATCLVLRTLRLVLSHCSTLFSESYLTNVSRLNCLCWVHLNEMITIDLRVSVEFEFRVSYRF